MTDTDLQYWYWRYNKKYFQRKLPRAVIEFKNARHRWLGITYNFPSPGRIRVYIAKEMRMHSTVVMFTLLHEMVHVKLLPYGSHGFKFQKEMLRLAKAGAFKELW